MLTKQTVIPSALNGKNLDKACQANSDVVLLSGVNIGNVGACVQYIHKHKKRAFMHIDITGGFRPDQTGIRLLKSMFHLDGVTSTNMHALSTAKVLGLETVYRLFLIDSRSLERAAGLLKDGEFSAIEILPSRYAVSEEKKIRTYVGKTDLIAGGFIRSKSDIDKIFNSNFIGVTTSNSALWK